MSRPKTLTDQVAEDQRLANAMRTLAEMGACVNFGHDFWDGRDVVWVYDPDTGAGQRGDATPLGLADAIEELNARLYGEKDEDHD